MKYIRVFETYFDIFDKEKLDNIKIGDYVLATYYYTENKIFENYINKNIGQVVDISGPIYNVKYIVNDFAYNTLNSYDKKHIKEENNVKYIIIEFRQNEIEDAAPTEIELEMKISTTKYNL
jgi:hypothetical protein